MPLRVNAGAVGVAAVGPVIVDDKAGPFSFVRRRILLKTLSREDLFEKHAQEQIARKPRPETLTGAFGHLGRGDLPQKASSPILHISTGLECLGEGMMILVVPEGLY